MTSSISADEAWVSLDGPLLLCRIFGSVQKLKVLKDGSWVSIELQPLLTLLKSVQMSPGKTSAGKRVGKMEESP